MNTRKSRRSHLARYLGDPMLAERQRTRTSIPSRLLLLDHLEPRILLAGTPSQLIFTVQPSQTAAASGMFPSIQVEIADSLGQQTFDTSKVTLVIAQGPAGATINNGTAVSANAISGIASFDNLIFSTPGTYVLRANDGILRAATSNTFIVTAPATQLNFQHTIPTLIAGQLFDVTAEVDDANGPGHLVTTDRSSATLTIYSGPTASVILGTVISTAINGVFTFNALSLPGSGSYRLAVSDAALTHDISNAFTVNPGAPAALAFAAQPSSTPVDGAISPDMTVAVIDDFGNIVTADTSAVTLDIFSANPTVGTLSGITTVAAINGMATFSGLSINTAGAYVLQANAGTLSGNSSSFNITGAADHLDFLIQPGFTAGNDPITPGVQVAVEDALNHVIVSDASNVTVTLAGAVGTLSGTTTVQAINGVATFSDLSINAGGDFTLLATDDLLTGATSNIFSVAPPAVSVKFAPGPSSVALNSVMFPAIIVDVLDLNGNTITTNTSTVTIVIVSGPTGGVMNGTTTVDAVAGHATFDNLTFTKQGTYSLLAYDGNLVTETSMDFVVTAPAAKLAFVSQPVKTSMAGVVLPAFSIRVNDAKGNTVSSDHSDVTLAILGPTGATIGGTTTVTAINGIATFNDIMLTIAGKYNFVVTDGTLAGATSSSLTITPLLTAIPDSNNAFLYINPMFTVQAATTNTLVGKTIPTITIRQEDMFHNLITTVNSGTASVHILSGPQFALNGTLTAKFVKGVATIKNLTINTAGKYVIRIDESAIIPDTIPYPVVGTANHSITITPVINTMRAPSVSTNYAVGGTISLKTSVGSLVSSSGILYTNGTVGESVRLVTAAGVTLETGTVTSTGAVTLGFNDLALGSYDVQVIYDGDTNHTGARSPIFHFTVGPTLTTLTTPGTVLKSGGTLALTATVKLNSALLTVGTVDFYEDNVFIGTTTIGTTSSHTAVLNYAPSATGSHNYQAVFVANGTLNSSSSILKLVTTT